MYLLGYDIGSSSVKTALVNADTGAITGIAQHPDREMEISAPLPDQAEQSPDAWWEAACAATRKLLAATGVAPAEIAAIGISYQMHGLVVVDRDGKPLRPSIIWCDSRAVDIGKRYYDKIGREYCLEHFLNSPGNFTASKLRWVRENEPELFSRIDKFMLPGDYIAFRMTGDICTTPGGLSEGILWDFKNQAPAEAVMAAMEIPSGMCPRTVPAFSDQGRLSATAAGELGLRAGIQVGYRAGDQPNNALTMNVLRPGEIAATGGTSGVVYAVAGGPVFDPGQRVNSFAHVNYAPDSPLTGVLLCINGAGSQYRWMRQHIGDPGLAYHDMEQLAASAGIGADGVCILPFGNGAERMLDNRIIGSHIAGLNFNRHEKRHLYRAALEGIAFSFVYGVDVFRQMGIPVGIVRAGNDNLFRSAIFSETVSTLIDAEIQLIASTGAAGAARASGVAAGLYASAEEALAGTEVAEKYIPGKEKAACQAAFERWKAELDRVMKQQA